MSEISSFTVFVIANALQFAFGVAITGISYSAYLSSDGKAMFRYSTIGFLLITVGGVIAPIYELGFKRDYHITGRELLELQIMEGTVIAVGLAFLIYSIYSHGRRVERVTDDADFDTRYLGERENW